MNALGDDAWNNKHNEMGEGERQRRCTFTAFAVLVTWLEPIPDHKYQEICQNLFKWKNTYKKVAVEHLFGIWKKNEYHLYLWLNEHFIEIWLFKNF